MLVIEPCLKPLIISIASSFMNTKTKLDYKHHLVSDHVNNECDTERQTDRQRKTQRQREKYRPTSGCTGNVRMILL